MNSPRRILVVVADRANYGRLFPLMKAIELDPKLELLTICAGSMLLYRFGQAENVVIADGFRVDGRVFLEVEGSVPATMAKSIGLGIIEFSNEYQRLQPDILLIIGDRYEALSAVVAAAYMNIPIAHVQGGEVSGSIDECCRHAISKFSHLHFPSTTRAAEYLIKMGEDPAYVHCVGCPAGDYIIRLDSELSDDVFSGTGVGAPLDPKKPFFVVIFHPVSTEFGKAKKDVSELLAALDSLAHPTVWVWPNIDAGSDDISKVLRIYRENHHDAPWLHLVRNLNPVTFQRCLKRTACAIGNSSSFVRDTTFSGTPVVLVGNRQSGREHGNNVIAVTPSRQDIVDAIQRQLQHGRYEPDILYGNGTASDQIVKYLKSFVPYKQKTLHFVREPNS